MAHSPAPWGIGKSHSLEGADGKVVRFYGEGIVIAMSSPTEQERDNYSLLKAAPELLEALQERISADRCESPIRKPLPNPRGFLAQDELLDCGSCGYCKARAAIAKATQEAPNASSS